MSKVYVAIHRVPVSLTKYKQISFNIKMVVIMLISWYSRNSLNEGDEMIVRSKQQLDAKKPLPKHTQALRYFMLSRIINR